MQTNNLRVRVIAGALAMTTVITGARAVRAITAAQVTSPFYYNFTVPGWLDEAGSMAESWSPYYWVNSGGALQLTGGVGQTIQGELGTGNFWRLAYAAANPLDTDGGLHPQNIFRLVTRSAQWNNMQQEVRFWIAKYNVSASPNRAEHNGFLLFNRYVDGNNLYYTGIRVDGSAIIKRKKAGVYCTLAEVKGVYPGVYNRVTNPNLIPTNTWIGLRSQVLTLANGSVSIKVSMDKANTNQWALVAQAVDDGVRCGSAPMSAPGSGGIRTDFMDVKFDNHKLLAL